MMDKTCLVDTEKKFQEKNKSLDDELKQHGHILYELLQEKNKYLKYHEVEADVPEDSQSLFHYKYILPLVQEIHLLELQVKERQQNLEDKKLKHEANKLGQKILTDSLDPEDCVLKQCASDLIHLSQKAANQSQDVVSDSWSIGNMVYNPCFTDEKILKESLAFTVLNKGVHVRVRIQSKTAFTNKHFLLPTEASLCVDSDTFIEGLQDIVCSVFCGDRSILDVVQFVSEYIENDMAPYVIIVPMRKKKKVKKESINKT
ncbi:hypothetical protein Bpfe_012070 [Biomphalaria pfeifferi]|uniref:Uncharacterized protein n=1 Tax=Biomphalaria pfeifferi TaxID=112525 RepID=A0AAD8FC48_BIOPF|nr:hypothetical protein Bpfe_012070 [Biomphalaria pfeifferi]